MVQVYKIFFVGKNWTLRKVFSNHDSPSKNYPRFVKKIRTQQSRTTKQYKTNIVCTPPLARARLVFFELVKAIIISLCLFSTSHKKLEEIGELKQSYTSLLLSRWTVRDDVSGAKKTFDASWPSNVSLGIPPVRDEWDRDESDLLNTILKYRYKH